MTMRALLLLCVLGCGSKSPAATTSNTSTTTGGSAVAASDDTCLEGGVVHTAGAAATAACKFWGEQMGDAAPDGKIIMNKCCYPTAEAACKNTGCEVKDCTFDAKATTPTPVTCKDTTHGGVPTNP